MNQEVIAYRKHMNLKLAAAELGVAWQSLYVRLKQLGEPVTGDKMRYGGDRDKLAAMAEAKFLQLVPFAVDQNKLSWQSKFDFSVMGHLVDVKSSIPKQLNARYPAKSWAFSFKKQSLTCDFICCFCLDEQKEIEHVLLVPREFFVGLQTISVSQYGSSKWLDYSVKQDELSSFFISLGNKQ